MNIEILNILIDDLIINKKQNTTTYKQLVKLHKEAVKNDTNNIN